MERARRCIFRRLHRPGRAHRFVGRHGGVRVGKGTDGVPLRRHAHEPRTGAGRRRPRRARRLQRILSVRTTQPGRDVRVRRRDRKGRRRRFGRRRRRARPQTGLVARCADAERRGETRRPLHDRLDGDRRPHAPDRRRVREDRQRRVQRARGRRATGDEPRRPARDRERLDATRDTVPGAAGRVVRAQPGQLPVRAAVVRRDWTRPAHDGELRARRAAAGSRSRRCSRWERRRASTSRSTR